MEKIFRSFDTHQQADAASREDARQLTTAQRLTAQRLTAFSQRMKPAYESAPGLQRIYRTRNLREAEVPGDWRLGI